MAENNTLTITDNRTNKTYTVPVENGTIRAMDLRQIKTSSDDFGLMTYDPAFMNTASCKSAITYIDGDKGILRYRGYPIEVLAERCTFLEVTYLLLFGELPTEKELSAWVYNITHHTMLHETTKKFMEGFRYSSHPMAMFVSTIAALSSVYPDAKNIHDPANRMHQITRLIGKVPSIAAMSYRHNVGFPYVYPDNDLSYTENFMNMLWKMVEPKYVANPAWRGHSTFCLFCTPTTNRIAAPTQCARSAVRRQIRIYRWRQLPLRWRGRCTGVRTKKC